MEFESNWWIPSFFMIGIYLYYKKYGAEGRIFVSRNSGEFEPASPFGSAFEAAAIPS